MRVIKPYFKHVGLKKLGARNIVREFPNNGLKVLSVHRLIYKIRQTGTTERKTESGRPSIATTQKIKECVEKIISQKQCPGTHKSQR